MSAELTPAQTTPTVAMIRTLGLVATLCGLIIVGAYQGTYEAVQVNKRLALEREVFKVFPAAQSMAEYYALAGGGVARAGGETPAGAVKFYAAYDGADQFIGIAAEGAAKGYADTVRILFGYVPACQCITGFGVVAMRETPGIGDKILTDVAFRASFKALDVKLNAELAALANAVVTVKHGTRTHDWQIDAISGATITSRAVGRAINDAAQVLLPRLVPHVDQVKENKS